MLSAPERHILAVYCWDHAVVRCDDCRRDYRLRELGTDYFCPLCRLDFVDDLRLHILGCRAIFAAIHARVERSRELKKESDRLVLSSAILAAESQSLAKRVLDTMRQARQAPPTS